MNTINATDTIMARAICDGRTVVDFKGCGFSSLTDVIRAVREAIGSAAGMFRIVLRNATAGWSQQRSLFVAPVRAGVQLSLF